MDTVFYMVIPCYNEEDTLPKTAPVFLEKLRSLIDNGTVGDASRILFVNDGSADRTWEIVRSLHESDPHFVGINLAHNVGEQYAMIAGMETAEQYADCIITMDCDLQDDIDAVDRMLAEYHNGCELVFGVRSDRSKDSFSERTASGAFYKIMDLLQTGLVHEHANYRLMSKKALRLFREYTETNLYLPSAACLLGLKTGVVAHERFVRAAGTTGYSLMKRVRLAVDAITSYSAAPLWLLTATVFLNAALFLVSAVCLIVFSVKNGAFHTGLCVVCSVWLIGCMLSAALRILCGYAYRALGEAKKRPRYQIDTVLFR